MHAGIGLVVLQSMYLQAVGRYPTLPGLGYKRHPPLPTIFSDKQLGDAQRCLHSVNPPSLILIDRRWGGAQRSLLAEGMVSCTTLLCTLA
jgi:hypothetical protein